jgi:hypothetical protein
LRLHLIPVALRRFLPLLLVLASAASQAAVLPEDRADIMYHRYSGGGLNVDGPSILVRKKFGESFSVTGSYYVDAISSASIDVVTTASPYTERHVEKGLTLDYLHGKTTYTVGYMNSEESDYKSDTMSFGLSQDMFGDLTTVSIGYSQGWDTVGKRGDAAFVQDVDRRSYRVGLSQVLTRSMLLSLNYESNTEQGYLHSPYRSMRFNIPGNSYGYGPEVYPETRTGNAGAARLKYFLPWKAAVEGGYRFYSDTWGITAHTASIEYTQPMWGKWVFNGSYRFYTQTGADFYSDLFPNANYQNFMARQGNLRVQRQLDWRGRELRIPGHLAVAAQEGHDQLPVQLHDVRLQGFPGPDQLPAGYCHAGQRAAVLDEREHLPAVSLDLVLAVQGENSCCSRTGMAVIRPPQM